MRACGMIGASSSNDPAGIMTISESFAWRGNRPPQVVQNWFVNRFASGNLNARTSSSPLSQLSAAGWRKRFDACPAPDTFRQRVVGDNYLGR